MRWDRLGRLHCDLGHVMAKMLMEYPEGNEEHYVCVYCFRDGDDSSFVPVDKVVPPTTPISYWGQPVVFV